MEYKCTEFVIKILGTVLLVVIVSGCTTNAFKPQNDNDKPDAAELLRQADRFYATGNLPDARAAYLSILEENPADADALYKLGNIAFKGGDYEGARDYFSQTVKSAPRNAKAHYNLAVTHLTLSEQHFNFYTATAPESSDIGAVSAMLQAIYKFGNKKSSSDPESKSNSNRSALDSLVDEFN